MIDCRVDLSSCLNFSGRESGEAKIDSDEGGMVTLTIQKRRSESSVIGSKRRELPPDNDDYRRGGGG